MRHTDSILRRGILVACIAGVAATAVTGLAGCGRDPQQVQVTTGYGIRTGLTPTQRGKIRREALDVAQKGFDALQSGDPADMKPYWDPTYVAYFTRKVDEYAAKGQKRVYRFTKIEQFDVSEMNDSGTQVLVDILFNDEGHVETKGGALVTKPRNVQTFAQLTLDKKSGKWTISRLIAGEDVTK